MAASPLPLYPAHLYTAYPTPLLASPTISRLQQHLPSSSFSVPQPSGTLLRRHPSSLSTDSSRRLSPLMDTLVIFDFDHTIIDCNSDPWVVDHLGASTIMRSLYRTLPWTALMDRMMTELHARGKTITDIENSLRKIPLQPEMIRGIQSAFDLGCELHIVSDANSFFIRTILENYGLKNAFAEVHTNPADVDEQGVLRIIPFHSYTDPSHGCPLCPPNMCKGIILDHLKAKSQQTRKFIIYVGDGAGDYCPSVRLGERDHILARQGFPLWKLLQENSTLVKAEVHGWSSANDVEIYLLQLLNSENRSS